MMKIKEEINGVLRDSELRKFMEGYYISEFLNTYSFRTKKLQKIKNKSVRDYHFENKGYTLCEKMRFIAATVFLEGPRKKYAIFKDGNINNRHISNLMWSDNPKMNFITNKIIKVKEYVNIKGEKILKEVEIRSVGIEGYYVSEYSSIYSNKFGELRMLKILGNNFDHVYLSINGHSKSFYIKNLTIKAFYPHEKELNYVLYRDGDQNNKHHTNLIWSETPETHEQSLEYKKLEGFSKYSFSKDGKAKSYWKNEVFFLAPQKNNNGYFYFGLTADDGKKLKLFRSRIVAKIFIPNPDNLPYVDHKNRKRGDDRVENLSWVTVTENNLNKDFAAITEKTDKAIVQYDLQGELLKIFKNANEAAGYLEEHYNIDIKPVDLTYCANKNKKFDISDCKTSAGFKWVYLCEDEIYEPKEGEIFLPMVANFDDKIVDFPSYKISNFGNVINKKHKCKSPSGVYPCVNLYNKFGCKTIVIHIYVALFFVPGRTKERYWVNHKDENKNNPHFSNLEWVTPKENSEYSSHKLKIAVDQFDRNTGHFIKRFDSACDAGKIFGSSPAITNACRDLQENKTAYGFIWRYSNTENIPNSVTPIPKMNTKGKPIFQYDLNGNFIRKHISISEAARYLNKDRSSISKCCKGEQKTAYGFKWKLDESQIVSICK